jgi:hypothetical protein
MKAEAETWGAVRRYVIDEKSGRVARFFWVQHTQTEKYIPNNHKIYVPNGHKIY